MASKTPKYDAKISEILDSVKMGERTCPLLGEKWEMNEEELKWLKKFKVPPLDLCPQAKMLTLSAFGTGFQWWYHQHPETGKRVLSGMHPASGVKVLPDKEWHEKDFSEINLDFSTDGFFEKLYKLERSVPVLATRNKQEPVNSISIVSLGDENDILTFACKAKNSSYSICLMNGEASSEVQFGHSVSDTYNLLHSDRIHNSNFVRDSFDCINCNFVFDCRNCTDCFGTVNRRNAQYIFWGEQLTKEEYETKMKEVDLSCRSKLQEYQKRFQDIVRDAVWPESFNIQAPECVGEYIIKCLDCRYCYACADGPQHCFWCVYSFHNTEDLAYVDGASNVSRSYYSTALVDDSDIKFCYTVMSCRDMEYCLSCYNCESCFGCVGLNRKQFHIFNKEYSENEYWQKVDELKCAMLERGEYGNYFPIKHSFSQFMEAIEPTMLGLDTVEIAKKIGANLFDPKSAGAVGDVEQGDAVDQKEVPDCIKEIGDDWVGRPIFDPDLGRRFAYFQQELDFYRKHKIAPPNRHFILRVKDILAEGNVARYEKKTCTQCQIEVEVAVNMTYPERKIYCQKCYLDYLEKYG